MSNPIYPEGTKLYVTQEKRPYKVQAADERYVIATKSAFGTVLYFICDFEKKVRGPDGAVFSGGYETQDDCKERLAELHDMLEVSYRRSVPLIGFRELEITKVVLPDGTQGRTPREVLAQKGQA